MDGGGGGARGASGPPVPPHTPSEFLIQRWVGPEPLRVSGVFRGGSRPRGHPLRPPPSGLPGAVLRWQCRWWRQAGLKGPGCQQQAEGFLSPATSFMPR